MRQFDFLWISFFVGDREKYNCNILIIKELIMVAFYPH